MPKVLAASIEEALTSRKSDDDANFKSYQTSRYEAILFGIATVIGGQFYGWIAGYGKAGFGSYAVGQILMGIAYIFFVCSLAEINSTVPFSGGSYGLVRVCIGYYIGYIHGMLEWIQYIIYTTAVVFYLGQVLGSLLGGNRYYQWIIWAIYSIFSSLLLYDRKHIYWKFMTVTCIFSVVILLIYCFGTIIYINFDMYTPYYTVSEYASITNNTTIQQHEHHHHHTEYIWIDHHYFIGGMISFMNILPLTTWAYSGIETLSLTVAYTKNPKDTIPTAYIISIAVLFTINMLLLFLVPSQDPGINLLSQLPYPLNTGYNRIFGITDKTSTYFIIPAQLIQGLGFLLVAKRLLYNLHQSNLIHPYFYNCNSRDTTSSTSLSPSSAFHHPSFKIQIIIICTIQCLIFSLCILSFYINILGNNLNNIAIFIGFLINCNQIYVYLMLRGRYMNLERSFRSPFGIIGALFSLCYFMLGAISFVGFQYDDTYFVLIVVLGLISILSIYYYTIIHHTQLLSKEESSTLFRFNVINANMRRLRRNNSHRRLVSRYGFMHKLSGLFEMSARLSSSFMEHSIGGGGSGSGGGGAGRTSSNNTNTNHNGNNNSNSNDNNKMMSTTPTTNNSGTTGTNHSNNNDGSTTNKSSPERFFQHIYDPLFKRSQHTHTQPSPSSSPQQQYHNREDRSQSITCTNILEIAVSSDGISKRDSCQCNDDEDDVTNNNIAKRDKYCNGSKDSDMNIQDTLIHIRSSRKANNNNNDQDEDDNIQCKESISIINHLTTDTTCTATTTASTTNTATITNTTTVTKSRANSMKCNNTINTNTDIEPSMNITNTCTTAETSTCTTTTTTHPKLTSNKIKLTPISLTHATIINHTNKTHSTHQNSKQHSVSNNSSSHYDTNRSDSTTHSDNDILKCYSIDTSCSIRETALAQSSDNISLHSAIATMEITQQLIENSNNSSYSSTQRVDSNDSHINENSTNDITFTKNTTYSSESRLTKR